MAIAIISSVITYWIKSISDRKFRRELSLSVELKKYKIRSRRTNTDLTVAYKGNQYENLSEYSIAIKNTGMAAIENQKILVKFPEDCTFIDEFKSRSSQSIRAQKEVLNGSRFIEHLHMLDRLESSDQVTFTYLIDTSKPDALDCQPRGVDGVNYVRQGVESVSDTHRLISITALFVACGAIPFFGRTMQAGVLLLATPIIVDFVQSWRSSIQLGTNPAITIQDVTVEGGGKLDIRQGST